MTQSDTQLIADALEAHDHEDWYNALLLQAIEQTGSVELGIKVADEAYRGRPEDDSEPTEDDEEALTS